MICRSSVCLALAVICTASLLASAKPKKATVELTHRGQSSVVQGKAGKKERANLDDVQKFFPKVTTNEDRNPDDADGPEDFVDDVASSLDDAAADLLVGDQKPSAVCARDIKKFCGAGEMKKKHPLHCLGLLKDEQKDQIHKLCRVHVENSLTYACATDIDKLDCDPVMRSTVDCLSESMDQLQEDCADQVRLVARVVSKVNNAEVSVMDQNETHAITKSGGGEIDPNWHCPKDQFASHYDQIGCCEFTPENDEVCKEDKFSCVKQLCKGGKGRWILKLPPGAALGGHLCCGPTKGSSHTATPLTGVMGILEEGGIVDQTEDGQVELTSSVRRDLIFFFFLIAAVAWWKFDEIKAMLTGDSRVNLPGMPAIELTNFFQGLMGPSSKINNELQESKGSWVKNSNQTYGSYGL